MVTDVTKLPIQFDRDRVVAFCRERGIQRLSVFGSVLRDDFDPARSDIDVLADFKHEVAPPAKIPTPLGAAADADGLYPPPTIIDPTYPTCSPILALFRPLMTPVFF